MMLITLIRRRVVKVVKSTKKSAVTVIKFGASMTDLSDFRCLMVLVLRRGEKKRKKPF